MKLTAAFNPENVVLFGYSFKWTETGILENQSGPLKGTQRRICESTMIFAIKEE